MRASQVKSVLSFQGLFLACALLALLFIGVAAISYLSGHSETGQPNMAWQLWAVGGVPFALVTLLMAVGWALRLLVLGAAEFLEKAARQSRSTIRPTRARPIVGAIPNPVLKAIGVACKLLAAALTPLAVMVTFFSPIHALAVAIAVLAFYWVARKIDKVTGQNNNSGTTNDFWLKTFSKLLKWLAAGLVLFSMAYGSLDGFIGSNSTAGVNLSRALNSVNRNSYMLLIPDVLLRRLAKFVHMRV